MINTNLPKFRISQEGTWYFNNSKIERLELVRLFSSYLQKDFQGKYWLEGPYEKIPIEVEDTPFVIKEIEFKKNEINSSCWAITNTNEKILISKNNPFKLIKNKNKFSKPYIYIRDGIYALLLRSPYYHLSEFITHKNGWYGFWSDNNFFKIEKEENF